VREKGDQQHRRDFVSDIAYHFVIDPSGNIWEGREMKYKGSHTYGYNDDIGVVILGNFQSSNTLNQAQKNAAEALAKWLCYEYDLKMISSGTNMAPISTHKNIDIGTGNDVNQVCPGNNAAPWIDGTLRPNITAWGN